MQLLNSMISLIRRPSQIAEVAKEIASSSHAAIWEKVHCTAQFMGHHEARGYVRVRATSLIAEEVDHHLAARRFQRPLDRTALVEMATEASVRSVLSEMIISQLTAPEHQIESFRRAA